MYIPTGNNVNITCMFHANFINLHEEHNMHVIMLMYMHVIHVNIQACFMQHAGILDIFHACYMLKMSHACYYKHECTIHVVNN